MPHLFSSSEVFPLNYMHFSSPAGVAHEALSYRCRFKLLYKSEGLFMKFLHATESY